MKLKKSIILPSLVCTLVLAPAAVGAESLDKSNKPKVLHVQEREYIEEATKNGEQTDHNQDQTDSQNSEMLQNDESDERFNNANVTETDSDIAEPEQVNSELDEQTTDEPVTVEDEETEVETTEDEPVTVEGEETEVETTEDEPVTVEDEEIEVETTEDEPVTVEDEETEVETTEDEPVTVENEETEVELTEDEAVTAEDEETNEIEDTEEAVNEEESNQESEEVIEEEKTKVRTISLFSTRALAQPTFEQGDRNDAIVGLKKKLNAIGFGGISETNYYGDWTTTRVKQFQEYYGLSVNGKLDNQTVKKLNEVYNNPFQEGKRHEAIPEFKKKLNKLGYDGISLTNYFGSWSDTRLRQFQEDHGLRVNGIGDSITLKLLNVLVGQDSFKQGDRHEYLSTLKEQLNHVSFDGIKETTYFGNWTTTRVQQFQEYYGLDVNGRLDATTINKLDEVYNSPFQEGKRYKDIPDFKDSLNKLGYDGISLTNYFGNWSDTRLRQFQEDHGLRVNGIGDSVTLKLLNVLADKDKFQQGDRHQYLSTLKEQLNHVSFDGIKETTYFGNWTTTRVQQFQEYYGLNVNGKLDAATINKLDEVYNSPFQKGKRHKDIPDFKDSLNKLGYDGISLTNYFGNWSETRLRQFQKDYGLRVNGIGDSVTLKLLNVLADKDKFQQGDRHQYLSTLKEQLNHVSFDGIMETNYYGNWTTTRVKQFQEYYGLNVNGKLDAATINKLDEVYNSPFQKGKSHKDIPAFKEKLNLLGYDGISLTNYFGNWSDKRLRQFQEDHGLRVNGIGDSVTLAKLNSLLSTKTILNYTSYDITLAEALAMQMRANPQTDKNYAYVSKKYVKNNKVTASALNVRSGPCACDSKIGQLQNGDQVKILGEYNGWYQIEYPAYGWKDAAPSDVLYYLNPNNFVNDEKLRFQFLDLSKPSNTTASVLNKYLEGKGSLEGQGKAFIDASKKHGINDLYLLSHAILETGHGKSTLAQGVKVNGKTVYNMFGIGAVDKCPIECGSQRAYEEGWFTPYDAIVGGAKFISTGYIQAGQNTLYKMRWNPEGMDQYGYATHQYATDIGWAAKQVNNMYNMYKDIGIYNLVLDIPKYKS